LDSGEYGLAKLEKGPERGWTPIWATTVRYPSAPPGLPRDPPPGRFRPAGRG